MKKAIAEFIGTFALVLIGGGRRHDRETKIIFSGAGDIIVRENPQHLFRNMGKAVLREETGN